MNVRNFSSMISIIRKSATKFHQKMGGMTNCNKRRLWMIWLLPLIGLLSLIWFLIRVLPKPSRASYPCQRMAFPLASAFVIWIMGGLGSVTVLRRAKHHFLKSRYLLGLLLVATSVGIIWLVLGYTAEDPIIAAEPQLPNQSIGVAKGIHPGRVVWVHNPDATDWEGPGKNDGHWWDDEATSQHEVERMLTGAIRSLTGMVSNSEAWHALFTHFNESTGRGNMGYQVGEKVMVKINLVATHFSSNNVDSLGNQIGSSLDVTGPAPQLVTGLVRQLVYEAGVGQVDITLGDTLTRFPNQYWEPIQSEFPDVTCIDYHSLLGRTRPRKSDTERIYWSDKSSTSRSENIPTCFTDATYVINLAVLKAHPLAGVTLCGKNHFGSLCRTPADWWNTWDKDYLDWHISLPDVRPGMGKYRAIVDLMGCRHLGGKTVLYLLDGFYAGDSPSGVPLKWDMEPFNGDWPSSLFVSQDPVAIDSVGYDFLRTEFNGNGKANFPLMSGVDDYLHEAAQADNPASGVFYDPDHEGDVTRLESLGVHEHWNNPVDKLYSRNLGENDGIELIALTKRQIDFNADGEVGFEDLMTMMDQWLNTPTDAIVDIAPMYSPDGIVDFKDFAVLAEYWRSYPGLVARWALDETEGDTAHESAAGYDGTLIGSPVWQPDGGKLNGALLLDGINDYVKTDPVLNPADGVFSVVVWLKGGTPGQAILSQANGVNWLSIDSVEGYLMTELKNSGRSSVGPMFSDVCVADGQWYRIGLVWDGSFRHLYVDGTEIAKDIVPLPGLEDAYGGLYFGTSSTLAPNTFFSGLIDDIRIYNRVVTH